MPGVAAAWYESVKEFGSGTVTFAEVMAHAIRLAEEGWEIIIPVIFLTMNTVFPYLKFIAMRYVWASPSYHSNLCLLNSVQMIRVSHKARLPPLDFHIGVPFAHILRRAPACRQMLSPRPRLMTCTISHSRRSV